MPLALSGGESAAVSHLLAMVLALLQPGLGTLSGSSRG